MVPDEPRATGPLRPIELATAAVLAGVSVALVVIGWFLPHLGPVAALAVVPLGVVAHRHRFRALVAATFSAALISFLVAGTGTFTNVVECAIVGGLVGIARRRDWSFKIVLAFMAVIAPILATISVALLLLFSSLRKLTLEQIANTWKGDRQDPRPPPCHRTEPDQLVEPGRSPTPSATGGSPSGSSW